MLILPVKDQILRTWGEGGKKWQNLVDFLYGWPLRLSEFSIFFDGNFGSGSET